MGKMDKGITSIMATFSEMFDVDNKSSSNLFEGATFKIPENQRAYEWQKSQVDAYFDDIFTKFRNKDDYYFMGNITMEDNKNFNENFIEIQDGQQRMTTTIIFILALKKFLILAGCKLNSKSEKDKLKILKDKIEKYLYVKNKKRKFISGLFDNTIEDLYSFSNNDELNMFVKSKERVIIPEDSFKKAKEIGMHLNKEPNLNKDYQLKSVEINILNSYTILFNKIYSLGVVKDKRKPEYSFTISGMFIDNSDTINITDFFDYLVNNVLLNVMRIKSPYFKKMKYVMFETINDRGLSLKESDKIKNNLTANILKYKVLPTRTLLEDWKTIIENTDTKIEEFVRIIVTIIAGKHVQKKKVYEEFKNVMVKYKNDGEFSLKFIELLKKYSYHYRSMIERSELYRHRVDEICTNNLYTIKEYGVLHLLLLTIVTLNSEEKMLKKLIEKTSLLGLLLIGLGLHTEYKKPDKLTKLLTETLEKSGILNKNKPFHIESLKMNQNSNFDKFFYSINKILKEKPIKENNIYLTKKSLIDGIKTSSKGKVLKQILFKYENHQRIKNNMVTILLPHNNMQETKFDLEHIMPVNPKKNGEWEITKKRSDYNIIINKIGNFVILTKKDNTSISNSGFIKKISEYKSTNQDIIVLNEFIEFIEDKKIISQWNKNAIDQRSEYLAAKIYESDALTIEKK